MGARHIDENTVRKRGCRTHLHVLLADEDGALGAVFFGVLPAAANHNVEGHESWFAALFLNLFDGTCTKAKKGLNVSHRCPRRPVPTLRIVVASSVTGTFPSTFRLLSKRYAPRVPKTSSSALLSFPFSAAVSSFCSCLRGGIGLDGGSGLGGSGFLCMRGRWRPSSPAASFWEMSSFTCSAVTLPLSALWISFCVSSSTSLPSGALHTKSISAVLSSSLIMRSPPRSPSTKAVMVFFPLSSFTVWGMNVPLMAMQFLIPYLRRLSTSALPSTTMTSSLSSTAGPAGRRSLPYSTISITRTD